MSLKEQLNGIYIISKGRPHCTTAMTLDKIGYKGDWHIVCGTNDDTLPQYVKNWGDRVLTFDWYDWVKKVDLMDNFGVEHMGSGAVPVRNATREISFNRNELRHWQMDDDYIGFRFYDHKLGKYVHAQDDIDRFENRLFMIAKYAHSAGLCNAGFAIRGPEAHPENVFKVTSRVFNAHNLPSDPALFTMWKARMNDDLINAIDSFTHGKVEMSFKFCELAMPPSQVEEGGNTSIYKSEGTVRKTAYAVMMNPNAVRLTIRYGRYHHLCNWRKIRPMVISEKFSRTSK